MTTSELTRYHSHHEITEQGDSLRQTLAYVQARRDDLVTFFGRYSYDELLFVACGSSYWLSLSAQETFAESLNIRCSSVTSGDVLMNPDAYLGRYSRPLIITPSRSGSTSETLAAVSLLKEQYGCPVLALVEYVDSPLEQLADLTLHLPWANETSICQTRSFSNLYLALIETAALLSNNQPLLADLSRYVTDVDQLSQQAEVFVNTLLSQKPNLMNLITLGNGKLYGLCCEGAYISVEMAQAPAHFFYTLEFRHGPIVLLDESYLVVLFSSGNQSDLENKLIADIRTKGASVLAVAPDDSLSHASWILSPSAGSEPRPVSPEVLGLYGSLVTQLLAHYKALALGVNPDQPKDLMQWIKI